MPVFSDRIQTAFPELADGFRAYDTVVSELRGAIASELRLSVKEYRTADGMARKLARGHLLRGYDLLLGIAATLEVDADLACIVLERALDETYAALCYTQLKFDDCRSRGALKELLEEWIPRLAFGNRYMHDHREARFPKPVNVLTMVQQADAYLTRLGGERLPGGAEFQLQYDFLSGFAHPCQASLEYYQATDGGDIVLDRHSRRRMVEAIAGVVGMGNMLLIAGRELAEFRWAGASTGQLGGRGA